MFKTVINHDDLPNGQTEVVSEQRSHYEAHAGGESIGFFWLDQESHTEDGEMNKAARIIDLITLPRRGFRFMRTEFVPAKEKPDAP